MKNSRALFGLLGFGAVVAAAGWYGARNSPRDLRTKLWYNRLDKPAWNPPQFVFPIVWTALYSLIAVAGWRTWMQESSPRRSRALRLWAAQLATNAEWTRLFFGRHNPKQSLFDVLSLELQIVGYIRTVREVDPAAAACFLPYAAWVAFATLLNAEILRRNPEAEKLLPRAA
jgi:tryptophan-rich sensory protein